MARPRVIIHNLTSLDGRLDGFAADVGLYYELAGSFPHEAVLTGSGTMLAAAAAEGVDLAGEDPDEPVEPQAPVEPPAADDTRPWLVIVDSGGRLTRLRWLRGQPFWRDILVLCSSATPAEHVERLGRLGVPHLVVGSERVDLAAALGELGERCGVGTVRVDAGGGLNGALLRAGLVDEVSVVVAPLLVGTAVGPARHVVDGLPEADARRLELTSVERLRDGHVWLRYAA